MKQNRFLIILILFIAVISPAQNSKTRIAVTIDDLPLNIASNVTSEEMKQIVENLLEKIRAENIPVVGFVNEIKLERVGKLDHERIEILKMWLDAGVELGNHTYSHPSANRVPIEEYKENILKGERVLKKIMSERGNKPRYFRHPFLQTGKSLEVRDEIKQFLEENGYTIAPVTIDNSEWIFASAYGKAQNKNDVTLMKKIGDDYIDYMRAKLNYYKRQSEKLFGRQIDQILLIHSNRLNADYYSALCRMMREENCEFISVEEALKDEAYKSEDKFIGGAGISWMDRWALTKGMKKDFFAEEPRTPKYILDLAGVEYE
jgi:peptidoglycan/xylan/chitin deacetylase (PgdA/CDA1 family)